MPSSNNPYALLYAAILDNDLKAVQGLIVAHPSLLKDVALHQKTAPVLLSALNHRSSALTCFLITQGCDVDIKDQDGQTALMWASGYGDLEVVQALIDAGADVNAHTEFQENALMTAVRKDHVEVMQRLIHAGAHVNAQTESGVTALMYASFRGHLESVEILLQNQASVELENHLGDTALIYAITKDHLPVVEQLMMHQKDPDFIHHKNKRDHTALACAVRVGSLQMVQKIISLGAEVEEETLHLASYSHNSIEAFIKEIYKVQQESKTLKAAVASHTTRPDLGDGEREDDESLQKAASKNPSLKRTL